MVKFEDVDGWLLDRGMCFDARDWLIRQKSMEEAWLVCKRGNWMLWVLGKLRLAPPEMLKEIFEVNPKENINFDDASELENAIDTVYCATREGVDCADAVAHVKIIRKYFPTMPGDWS